MADLASWINPDVALLRRLQQIGSATPELRREPRWLFYMIEITEQCSLTCPVCYTAATSGHGRHKPLEQILALGLRVVEDGGRFVQLMGGEPAEHPHLTEIVRALCKIGLRPVLATNGVRLGKEPGFSAELRLAGLHKANIQFDTLDAATSTAIRGQDLVSLKRQAVANAVDAGLSVGLIAAMCDRNLQEAGSILRFAMGFTPRLNTVTFQSMVPVGRFPAALGLVDREKILSALLNTTEGEGIRLSPDDIMPPPQYAPWRALTHPSCSSLIYLCRDADSDAIWPLGRDVDIEQFYGILHAANGNGGRDSMVDTLLRPLAALLSCTRPGRRLATMQRMASLASGRGGRNLCIVHVDGIMHDGAWDDERARRCPACFVTDKGFISTCAGIRSSHARGDKTEVMP
jgi:uncharacterized radical SAM superfamily Fe-S cluster-containing enzyme